MSLGGDDVGVASLVDLPAIVRQPRAADELAPGTAALHLAEVEVAPVGEIVGGGRGVGGPGVTAAATGGRGGSDSLGGHVEEDSEARTSGHPMGRGKRRKGWGDSVQVGWWCALC